MEDIIAVKPPASYRTALTAYFFISGFGYATWASRIPYLQQHLHLNEAGLGAVLFAMPVGLMITMPVTGHLLGRFSSKNIMLFGAVLYNTMLGSLGFVSKSWQLAAVLFFFGASRNLFNLSVNAQAVGVQTLYKKSIMTTFHGIWSLAGFAGAGAAYLAIQAGVPARYHLFSAAAMLLLLSLISFPNALHQRPSKQTRKPVFSLPDKTMMKFAIICFASMACENTMYDWSGIYFQKAIHAARSVATAGFVAYMVAMTLGRFAGDRLVNRIGIKAILLWSGIFIFSGLALAVALPYPLIAGLGFMLVGFGVSCIVPLVFSLAGQSKTLSSGSAIAAVSTIGYLGFLAVPPMVGFVAQAVNLRLSFGLIALTGGLVVWMVGKIK